MAQLLVRRSPVTALPSGRNKAGKVFTLQTLPASDEAFDNGVGKVADFFPARGRVSARADQRQKLERLSAGTSVGLPFRKRLSLTPNGNVRLSVEDACTATASTHVIFEPLISSRGWRPGAETAGHSTRFHGAYLRPTADIARG